MNDAITIPTRMKCLYLNGGLNRSPVATLAKRILSLQTGRSVKSCNQAELKGTVHVIVSLLRCSIITNDTCKGLNSVRLVRLVGEVVISMGALDVWGRQNRVAGFRSSAAHVDGLYHGYRLHD